MRDPIKTKEITKARLIAALLNELDATWATVLGEDKASGVVFNQQLQCDLKTPFEASEVVFDIGTHNAESLTCVCCFGGQRLQFELHRISGNRWRLPDHISIVEFRHDPRLAFASKMYSAEMISARGALYGYAVDINRECLAIDVDSHSEIADGDVVQVIIRIVNTSYDIFYSQCILAIKKSIDPHKTRLIFRLGGQAINKYGNRRHERRPVQSSSIQISEVPIAEETASLDLAIQNIGLGGITTTAKGPKRQNLPIPGMIVQSNQLDLSFLVVWAKEDAMGLRPLLSTPKELANWCHYVDSVAPPDDHDVKATRKELANILTHSGLLKGKRRDGFGRELEAHLISQPNSESVLISQRRIVTNESGEPILYANLRRYTEQAWLFTDGVSFSDQKGSFIKMVQNSIASTRSIMEISSQLPRYMTFIWHHTVKSSGEFAELFRKQADTLLVDSAQMSIKAVESKFEHMTGTTRIDFLRDLSAKTRRHIAERFVPELWESIVGFDGSHPILNGELSRLGPYHKTSTKVVESGSGDFVIGHRIFTHSVWSTTGVTNSVFVLCPMEISSDTLAASLLTFARDEISQGTDDFLVIFSSVSTSNQEVLRAFPNPKAFTFLAQDLFQNSSLIYRDAVARRSEND